MRIHFTSKMKVHFTPKAKVHFMGVGGSGMAGISFLASKMGYEVTGCDLEESTAYSHKFFHGHSPDHLEGIDLLVVTPAVYFQKTKNPELTLGERKKIVLTWQEFLGKYLHKGKKVICIAGTHGKSTTTAMVGKLLEDAGLDPLVNLGANYKKWKGGARFGKGDYFVTEADEFYDNFLNYHPEIIILNDVEFDHPDFFKSEEQMLNSYKNFTGNLKGKKILITQEDSLNKKFNLKVFGEHNQRNANMAYLLGKKLGIKEETIVKSLESFPGIGRRMELISEKVGINPDQIGVKVYDDYAHHPTAIKATLDALRENYKDRRIWAVYEAHSYSRTKALLPNYKGVFDSADRTVIGPIFKARDTQKFGMSPHLIASVSGHKDVKAFDDLQEMMRYIKNGLSIGDIVIVMGAGKSYLWAKEICNLKI